jgi:hypothetical protein
LAIQAKDKEILRIFFGHWKSHNEE